MADPKHDGGAEAFSAIEEEFFRAGDAISEAAASASGSVHEAAPARTGMWSRLFRRTSRSVTAQPIAAAPRVARPATEPIVPEDEWDWQIAIARARHSTSS